jgi:hypothetical protein
MPVMLATTWAMLIQATRIVPTVERGRGGEHGDGEFFEEQEALVDEDDAPPTGLE